MSFRRLLVSLVCLATGSGCIGSCFGSSASEFPPGLDPLEPNTAPRLPAQPGDPYPEGVSVVTGTNDMYSWGHARGYIHAPSSEVYTALHDAEVVADRRGTDEQMYTYNTEPDYEYSFQIHYIVHDVIDVDWDEAFRFGTIEGTPDMPKLALIRSQKIYGLNLIHLIETSIQVHEIDANTTEIEEIEHLNAYMAGEGDIKPYLTDLYNSVLAVSHGQPLPTY